MDRRRAFSRLCTEHKDRVSILRLSLAQLSTVFSKQLERVCQPRQTREVNYLATVNSKTKLRELGICVIEK